MEKLGYALFIFMISMMLIFSTYYIVEVYNKRIITEPIIIEVNSGETVHDIAIKMEEKGLIKHSNFFVLWAKLNKKAGKIRAGYYEFSGAYSINDILSDLTSGKQKLVKITIPEGFSFENTLERIKSNLNIDINNFKSLLTDKNFIQELGFGPDVKDLSGFLFPETYLVPPNTSERELIKKMVKVFWKNLPNNYHELLKKHNMNLNQMITMASIIQGELYHNDEAKKISAVYHNRYKRGWKLEADPTVKFALKLKRDRIYFKDLKVDSPYNTYKYKGLPPTPINSPGKVAIDAAFFPEQNFDYLYFVAKDDKYHAFTKTLEEHNKMIKLIRGNK